VRLSVSNNLGFGLTYPTARENSVRNPSGMISVADSYLFRSAAGSSVDTYRGFGGKDVIYGENGIAFEHGAGSYWRATGMVWRAMLDRHNARFNTLFCDSHVESIPHDNLFAKNDTALRRWNLDNEPHPEHVK
jgi:prepilin-type processing-associated H-X9-DG protein